MWVLASKTGWARDYILWELSLCEVMQYQHCMLRENGAWTVAPINKTALYEAAIAAAAQEDAEWLGELDADPE